MTWRIVLLRLFASVSFCSCLFFVFSGADHHDAPNQNFWTPASLPHCYYNITCRIDTAQKNLNGSEVVRIKNPTNRPMHRLALDWSVNNRQTLRITVKGIPVAVLTDSGQTNLTTPILFDLPQALAGGASMELELAFSQSVPQLVEQDNILLTKWFPRLWWGVKTQDDFDVRIDIPSTYALTTSGRYDEQSGTYHAENIVTFGLFLGKGLHVAEATAGDVLVRCLYTARADTCAHLILRTATDAINFYRQWLGFYPYKSLSIVPGFDEPMGGYNAATSLAVIHGEERMSQKPEIHWQWITAHEVGHMYWGEYVMEKDSPGWLWIGLGIYADREYIRARGLSLQMHRELMNRYIQGVREHVNTTVAITPEERHDVNFDFNNIVTHGKGFSIISALANYLGKETFGRIYMRCLKEFGGKRLGAAEFQLVCEAESSENLGWFFDAWVHSNEYLSYQVTSQNCMKEDDKYVSTISVERLGTMKMPVPVVCYFEDGTSQQSVTDRLLDVNNLHLTSKSRLSRVRIDPDSELAIIVPPPELTQEELTKKISLLPWSGAGKEALTVFRKAQELQPKGEDTWFKLGLMLYDGAYYQQALEAFKRTVAVSGDSSNAKFGALVWQGHIFDILGQREDALQKYRSALAIEAGQELMHGQYDIVINRKWVEERTQKPFQRK
jgi:hypothetical protein